MTARPENRSLTLACGGSRPRAPEQSLADARSRGCSPRTPMHRSPRPSPAQYARAWASRVPLGLNSASLHTAPDTALSRQRLRACRGAYRRIGALVAHTAPVRGGRIFAPGTTPLRGGGGGFVGGPACRPRRTAAARQSWPRSSPAWAPVPIRAGVPTPSKECAKNPHCAPPRAAPARWAARPVAWLGGFCARPV